MELLARSSRLSPKLRGHPRPQRSPFRPPRAESHRTESEFYPTKTGREPTGYVRVISQPIAIRDGGDKFSSRNASLVSGMHTDSWFYRFLKAWPGGFFTLLGLPAALADRYTFDSVEWTAPD